MHTHSHSAQAPVCLYHISCCPVCIHNFSYCAPLPTAHHHFAKKIVGKPGLMDIIVSCVHTDSSKRPTAGALSFALQTRAEKQGFLFSPVTVCITTHHGMHNLCYSEYPSYMMSFCKEVVPSGVMLHALNLRLNSTISNYHYT